MQKPKVSSTIRTNKDDLARSWRTRLLYKNQVGKIIVKHIFNKGLIFRLY